MEGRMKEGLTTCRKGENSLENPLDALSIADFAVGVREVLDVGSQHCVPPDSLRCVDDESREEREDHISSRDPLQSSDLRNTLRLTLILQTLRCTKREILFSFQEA